MPLPGSHDMTLVIGDTFVRSFTFKDSGGDAVDITGWTPNMHLRTRPGSTSANYDWGSLFDTSSAASGVVTLTVPAPTTASITAGIYSYDLEMTKADSTVQTYLTGTVTVLQDSTR